MGLINDVMWNILHDFGVISDKNILDMCSTVSVSSRSAYLSTPNFPNEYPPSQDCMCTLWAASEDVGIKLEATHFVVKVNNHKYFKQTTFSKKNK